MFDFRYHIVSLVAVFLALGIGVVMGSMTAERGVVSEQEKALIATIEKDYEKLRDDNITLTAQTNDDAEFAEAIIPLSVKGMLAGKRIAVVVTGSIGTPDLKSLKTALEKAGATQASLTTFTGSLGFDDKDTQTTVAAIIGTTAQGPALQAKTLTDVATWIAKGTNSKAIDDLTTAGFIKTTGLYDAPIHGVIVISGTGSTNNKNLEFKDLEYPLIKTFFDLAVTTVGAEVSNVKETSMHEFQNLRISTVDNIDTPAGLISLIYSLTGLTGDFGAKDTADSLMPVPSKS